MLRKRHAPFMKPSASTSESFDVYGTKMSYEWDQIAEEGSVLFEGGESARRFHAPDTDDLLIDELKPFTKREVILNKDNVSFIQGSGHGGSHPHLVQELHRLHR